MIIHVLVIEFVWIQVVCSVKCSRLYIAAIQSGL